MPLNNFGCSLWHGFGAHVYRSAQPDSDGFEWLRVYLGVKVVYKLSQEHEYPLAKEQSEFDPTNKLLVQANPMPELLRENEADHVLKIVTLIREDISKGNPCLVHCEFGKERTGLVCAALRMVAARESYDGAMANRRLYGVSGLRAAVDDVVDCPVLREIERRIKGGEIAS